MAEERSTFHESWYRIANQRICLRAGVRVRRQMFRGQRWYILLDPFSNQFFRLRPAAYAFVARLSMNRTVEQVWSERMARDPDNAPGQEDVIQLLAQLYHANLLHYQLPADSAKLFERYKKRKQRILQATFMNIMFFRVPLFDPDALVKRLLPAVRWLMSPFGALLWIVVVGMGLKLAIDHFEALRVQSQGILAPSNLALLYLGLILIKALHEFGHSFAVRRFGGEVHTMGIMFLVFNPIPYMDATSSWSFRSKWQRAFVGAAGMIVEVFVAALAMFVWANTGPGVLHSLAYNMVFIASVSTILFNGNPLLRFDGYYILSDLLDIPNLHQQASQQLRHLVERYAFGYTRSESPASTRKEAVWLTVFGITSGLYRVVVFTTILLFVADRFLLAGIIMAVICAVSWVLVPIVRLVRYLATNTRLQRTRLRAVLVTVGVFGGGLLLLYFVPFPSSFKTPGVLKAADYAVVVNGTPGTLEAVLVASGTNVTKDTPLLRLSNRELDFEIALVDARLRETLAVRQRAMRERRADLKPLDSRIKAIRAQLTRLAVERASLTVVANVAGKWVAPRIEDRKGMWLARGTPLGELINENTFYFSAVVPQQEASRLFSGDIRSSEVKFAGQADSPVPVPKYTKIPMEQTRLPSAALGWTAGGDVAVNVRDPGGTEAAEPFYEVRADVPRTTEAALYHGRSGRIRFKLSAEPLLRQWWRRLRQLLQKRYQI